MSRTKVCSVLLFLCAQSVIAKEPVLLFDVVAGREVPVALIGLQEAFTAPMANCKQHIADVVVSDIAYAGPDEIIAGFRVDAAQATNGVTLYRLDHDVLTSGQMRALQRLVKKGARLIVLAQTCGSGRFTTVREVWSKLALGR